MKLSSPGFRTNLLHICNHRSEGVSELYGYKEPYPLLVRELVFSSFGKCHHKSLDYPSASQWASLLDSTETSVISAFKGDFRSVIFTVVSSFKMSKLAIGLADNRRRYRK